MGPSSFLHLDGMAAALRILEPQKLCRHGVELPSEIVKSLDSVAAKFGGGCITQAGGSGSGGHCGGGWTSGADEQALTASSEISAQAILNGLGIGYLLVVFRVERGICSGDTLATRFRLGNGLVLGGVYRGEFFGMGRVLAPTVDAPSSAEANRQAPRQNCNLDVPVHHDAPPLITAIRTRNRNSSCSAVKISGSSRGWPL